MKTKQIIIRIAIAIGMVLFGMLFWFAVIALLILAEMNGIML